MNSELGLITLVVALVVGLIFISAIVFMASRSQPKKQEFQKKWQAILEQKDPKLAVLNADSLLDEALKSSRLPGATMGERLKSAKSKLSDVNGTWQAHKVRNRIAHETSYQPSKSIAMQSLKAFRRAIKDLGLL